MNIGIYKTNNSNEVVWVISLTSNEYLNIFKTLCYDLLSIVEISNNEKAMITQLETHLKNWQTLLSKKLNELDKQKQMGLLTELITLNSIVIPKSSVREGIHSWEGPDASKQDFIYDDYVIEVKSHKTSKSNEIIIFSKNQLYTDKKSLYLAVYSLSENKEGTNILDVIEQIKKTIGEDLFLLSEFESKLIKYGYDYYSFKDELFNFVIDKNVFYKIVDGFPRIDINTIPPEITSIKYKVDLSSCHNFLISKEEIN